MLKVVSLISVVDDLRQMIYLEAIVSENSTMRRRLLPLSALRAFEVAGRHESFQKAADELGVTTSAISRQVAELERIVGGKLFTRNIRKVELTEEGSRLRWSLTSALEEMTDALHETRVRLQERSSPLPVLSVHVSPTFATRILISHLPQFESAHPDVSVNLTVAEEHAGYVRSDYDILVDYSPVLPADPSAVLFQEDALPVCAPEYIGGEEMGASLALEDLLKGRLLSTTEDSWDWKLWAAFHKLQWPPSPRLMRFATDDLAIQAALAGTGIALVERRFITRELAEQRLVPVGRKAAVPLGYYCIRGALHADGLASQAFEEWLRRLVGTLEAHRPERV